jgi:hypothetical protein
LDEALSEQLRAEGLAGFDFFLFAADQGLSENTLGTFSLSLFSLFSASFATSTSSARELWATLDIWALVGTFMGLNFLPWTYLF